jgi:hypothetical protein
MVRRWLAALAAALGALSAAFFALWACGISALALHPQTTLQPAVPHAMGQGVSMGVGGGLMARPDGCPTGAGCLEGGSGQLWLSFAAERFELVLSAFGGAINGSSSPTPNMAAGGALRGFIVSDGALRLGVELQGGLLWAGIGIPLAAQAGEGFWIYTDPSISSGIAFTPVLRMPVGFAARIVDKLMLVGELGAIAAPLATAGPRLLLGGNLALRVDF